MTEFWHPQPGPEAAITLLDRADGCIQGPDHAQPVTQLADRRQPRAGSQRRIRRADPRQPALPLPAAYPGHQIGVFLLR